MPEPDRRPACLELNKKREEGQKTKSCRLTERRSRWTLQTLVKSLEDILTEMRNQQWIFSRRYDRTRFSPSIELTGFSVNTDFIQASVDERAWGKLLKHIRLDVIVI